MNNEERRQRIQAELERHSGAEAGNVIPMKPPKPATPLQADTVREQVAAIGAAVVKNKLSAAVAKLNERFFVAPEGGGVSIVEEGIDPETGTPRLTYHTKSGFMLLLQNEYVEAPETDGMGAKRVPVASYWLSHPQRRQYPNGIALLPGKKAPPGVYNLWAGLAVQPAAGDAGPAVRHIHEVICGGDRALTTYLIQLMARYVQGPDLAAEVAVVLRGGRGTGKGTFARWLLTIFGGHSLHVLHSRHLVGNFNAHLRGCLLLFADEAFFAGDRQGADVLKGLITEPTIAIERKGVDVFQVPNRLKIVMATNHDWAVPAGIDERRFFVLDVSDCHKQDHDYFAKLNAHMDNGGLAALLDYLLNLDISRFNPRAVPTTKALVEQKLLSLDALNQWLHDCLWRGAMFEGETDWALARSRNAVVRAFADFAREHGHRYANTSAEAVSKGIRKVLDIRDARPRKGDGRERQWLFPALDDCRRQFDEKVFSGVASDWPADVEDVESS